MAEPAGQFFDAQGKPLAGAALDEAWKSGAAHVAAGSAVHMLDENKDLRLVPAEQVAAARAKGYAPAPAEIVEQHALQREHGDLGGQAATVAESAADMASLGGYGYAAGKLAPGYAHDLLQRREANPISHVAGSIVGLAPSLAVGTGEADLAEIGAKGVTEGAQVAEGASGAARAAEASGGVRGALQTAAQVASAPIRAVGAGGGIIERGIERGLEKLGADGSTLAGRVATKALAKGAAGVAEGAVFGVGSTLSESSLEGKDLTSEALLSGIGRNALFGGAIGAGAGMLGELAASGIKAITPGKESLEKFSRGQAARTINTSGKDIEKLGGLEGDKFKSTMDELLGYEYKTDGAAGTKGDRLFSKAQNVTDIHEGLRQAQAETGAAKGGIVDEIDAAIQSKPEVAAVAQPNVGEFFDRVKTQVLDKLQKSDVDATRRMADKVERELKPLRTSWEASLAEPANDAAGVAAPPITFARLEKFKQDLGETIYGPKVKGAGIQVAPKSAKYLDKVRGILADFQDESAQKALVAMGEDPTQYATLNRQYSTLTNLEKIAGREAGKAAKNRLASPTDHALAITAFLGGLLSGNVGALGAMGFSAAAGLANNFARTRGNSILADIAYRTSKMDNLLENTAHALSLSPERLAAPVEFSAEVAQHKGREAAAESHYVPLGITALKKDFDETKERVQQLAEPMAQSAQIAHTTGEIAAHYPEQATAMATKQQAIFQHLQASIPQASGGSQISPMASPPRVSPREQMRFLTRVNAALDPAAVIKNIGEGKLDKDAVDTLKATYPATFDLLKQKVITKTLANRGEMPFARVVHIGNVFGFPTDSSMGPRLAGIQQAIAQMGQPEPAPNKPSRSSGKSNLGKAFELPGAATPGAH